MILMQRVQPEIKKIQQKYKDDRAKQNEELLKYYQENKINPLAGLSSAALDPADRHRGARDIPSARDPVPHSPYGNVLEALRRHVRQDVTTPSECGDQDQGPRTERTALPRHAPQPLGGQLGARRHRYRVPVLRAPRAGDPLGLVPGPPDPGPPGEVGRGAGRTRRCRPSRRSCRSSSGSSPTASAPRPRSTSSSRTLWRIGQQHFVLNKMYEEEHGKPAPEPHRRERSPSKR